MGAFDFALPVIEQFVSDHLTVDLCTGDVNTLWISMNAKAQDEPQNFSLPLLHSLQKLASTLKVNEAHWYAEGNPRPIHYAVMKSAHADYFNLGGDLKYFRECIASKNRQALYQYSRLCADMLYETTTSLSQTATNIALVQGRALGGGFEMALSADVLIAEEHSEFGFPEIMFGLFPCTGGMSLLARRVGVYQAERMMSDARIYSAAELKAMGIVDEVCPRGEGEAAVAKYIKNHAKRRGARLALQRGKYRIAPLEYQELITVVEEWVELAMQLTPDELRIMDMLIAMQRAGHR